ncbi:pilus assembly protein FilA [Acinetobacter wuhouensis]|uniref:putative pilus system protein FilA n=1 Tax=Acinetobacter wuhouensis TaxID=1879050 RepID=UPI00083B4706|nr:DUF6160 family protein [Acinetobacter wuhouensis]AXQ21416.1 pilus assembly protein FilA [Acinetobacter wuhouensis]
MKLFTKLALVSAVAVSSNAMAMQAMDDAALSSTTGQDGISIGIGISKVEIAKLHVFDGDGLGSTQELYTNSKGTVVKGADVGGTGTTGAITINNLVVSAPMTTTEVDDGTGTMVSTPVPDTARMLATGHLADVVIDTDGGNGSPFLNIAAAVSGLDISLGKIEVNNATGTSGAYVAGAAKAEILSGLSLQTGKMTANIQLGNTPQGAMIKLDGTMVGGLAINNLALKDSSTAGQGYIALGKIKINDAKADGTTDANLALDTDIAVKPEGLAITAMKGANGTNIYVQKIILGGGTIASGNTAFQGTGVGSASIGDVAISGMKVWNGAAGLTPGAAVNGAVITIAGH